MLDYPFDTTRTAVQMLLNGVIARNPDVRIILSHAGGFLPYASHQFAELAPAVRKDVPITEEILKQFQTYYFDVALSSSPAALPNLTAFAKKGPHHVRQRLSIRTCGGRHIVRPQVGRIHHSIGSRTCGNQPQ